LIELIRQIPRPRHRRDRARRDTARQARHQPGRPISFLAEAGRNRHQHWRAAKRL